MAVDYSRAVFIEAHRIISADLRTVAETETAFLAVAFPVVITPRGGTALSADVVELLLRRDARAVYKCGLPLMRRYVYPEDFADTLRGFKPAGFAHIRLAFAAD
jgi:hypothetical protein